MLKSILNFKTFNKSLSNIFINKFPKKFFNTSNTPATTGAAGTVAPNTPPPKTKDEIKIEKLMEQWPEAIKNPDKHNPNAIVTKESLEQVYKFHQGDKPYVKTYDIPRDLQTWINRQSVNLRTTDAIAENLEDFDGFLTDEIIADRFLQIAITHKDVTPELFDKIIPIVKRQILNADRQSNDVIGKIAFAAAKLNIGDTELWEMIVNM
jgi:hypothetical protein